MSKVYLPTFTNENCIQVLDKDTIRVYSRTPVYDDYNTYIDYYVNSHYLSKEGALFYDSSIEPIVCESHSNYTSDTFYRFDFDGIMIIFIIMFVIIICIPVKIISRAFGRWLKL